MIDALAKPALAWLLTYAVHSTLLLALAWTVSRRVSMSAATRDLVWKVALVGGIVTSFAQTQLGVRPAGSVSLARSAVRAVPHNIDKHVDHESDAAPSVADQPTQAPSGAAAFPSAQRGGVTAESALVILWGVLAVAFAVFYLGRRLILVGRLANRRAVKSGPLPAMLDALCRDAGYRSTIALTSVNTISSPVALGLREICLPDAALTQLDSDEQRGLLAHELAHLVRRDPIWLYGASLIERVFFFQPLNHVARMELQRNAEYLCDDWAAARTGSGLPLAHCLARVAEWIESSPLGVPVAGMAEQRSLLVTRVARLIDGKHSSSPMSKLVFSAAATALLFAVTAAAPGVYSGVLPLPLTSPVSQATEPQSPDDRPAAVAAEPDPVIVAALIERLKDSDAGVRRAAASSLGNLKARKAVGPLIDALNDRNKDVRAAIVESLANIEDPSAIPALAKLLTDESADVREHALDGLSHFSNALTVAQVLPALKDARPSLRAKGAEVLGEIGDRSAVAPLVQLLRDPSPEVRHETLHALEHLQDPSSAPSIVPALHDENADVREAALSALRELKATIPEPDVLSAFKDVNADVRKQAIEYVKERRSPSMVPVLKSMLDDSDSDVRQEAVDALSQIRDTGARAALREALKSSDPKVRRRAAEALGERP